jgi:hypothetical protein
MWLSLRWMLICSLSVAAFPCAAAVVLDYPPNLHSAHQSTNTFPIAQSFSLDPGGSVVRDAHWWGVCIFAFVSEAQCLAQSRFTLGIYEEESGQPGALHRSILSDDLVHAESTGRTMVNDVTGEIVGPEYFYSINFSTLPLVPNRTYFFILINTSGLGIWGWETADFIAPYSFRQDDHWVSENGTHAMQLTNDRRQVPEPLSILLLIAGFVGFAATRRVRRGRPQTDIDRTASSRVKTPLTRNTSRLDVDS